MKRLEVSFSISSVVIIVIRKKALNSKNQLLHRMSSMKVQIAKIYYVI